MRAHVRSGVLLLAIARAALAAGAPAPEAASALAPYAMWVGRLPAADETTWTERKALAFYRGRLGAWLEAELQVKSARSTPARHAELCVLLARAARFSEDWERARTWLAAAGEAVKRLPEAGRTVELLADYYAEAVALRELKDVRVAYGAIAPFLTDELSRRESFDLLRRLVDLAVVAGDEDSYTKLATSLLNTARTWTRESATPGGPSDADLAVGVFAESLITRGYAGTAAQIIEAGIADESLRQTLAQAAYVASVAKENDATISRFLAGQSTRPERRAALFGPDEQHAGVLVWLARMNRAAFAYQLLAAERDQSFAVTDGEERARFEQAWIHAVRRAATGYLRAGRAGEAARLGELFTETRARNLRKNTGDAAELADQLVRAGSLIDLREGLVGFATFLAEHGQTAEAQRLLENLPPDYPQQAQMEDVPEQYRAMREEAAESVVQQQRVALALAWAAAGDAPRAADVLKSLPAEDRRGRARWAIVRQRVLAAMAAGAAVHGETNLAERSADEARDAHAVTNQTSEEAAMALVLAFILLGRHEEAWQELADGNGAEPSVVITKIVTAIVARGRGNRVLEWISHAPDVHRRAAWRAYFAAAAPEPMVPPVRAE